MNQDDYRDGNALYPELNSITALLARIRSMRHVGLQGVSDAGVADMGVKSACQVCGGQIALYVNRHPTAVPMLYRTRIEVAVDECLLSPCVERQPEIMFLFDG